MGHSCGQANQGSIKIACALRLLISIFMLLSETLFGLFVHVTGYRHRREIETRGAGFSASPSGDLQAAPQSQRAHAQHDAYNGKCSWALSPSRSQFRQCVPCCLVSGVFGHAPFQPLDETGRRHAGRHRIERHQQFVDQVPIGVRDDRLVLAGRPGMPVDVATEHPVSLQFVESEHRESP
jgi:hypothetical protein